MSEKLNFAQSESNVERKEFADRFRVDPGDYPIFRQQVQPGDLVWFKGSRGMRLEETVQELYRRI